MHLDFLNEKVLSSLKGQNCNFLLLERKHWDVPESLCHLWLEGARPVSSEWSVWKQEPLHGGGQSFLPGWHGQFLLFFLKNTVTFSLSGWTLRWILRYLQHLLSVLQYIVAESFNLKRASLQHSFHIAIYCYAFV